MTLSKVDKVLGMYDSYNFTISGDSVDEKLAIKTRYGHKYIIKIHSENKGICNGIIFTTSNGSTHEFQCRQNITFEHQESENGVIYMKFSNILTSPDPKEEVTQKFSVEILENQLKDYWPDKVLICTCAGTLLSVSNFMILCVIFITSCFWEKVHLFTEYKRY